MKNSTLRIVAGLLFTLSFSFPLHANLRIMSYNIENFWFRFDGESGTITTQGAELDQDDLERLEIVAGIIN